MNVFEQFTIKCRKKTAYEFFCELFFVLHVMYGRGNQELHDFLLSCITCSIYEKDNHEERGREGVSEKKRGLVSKSGWVRVRERKWERECANETYTDRQIDRESEWLKEWVVESTWDSVAVREWQRESESKQEKGLKREKDR